MQPFLQVFEATKRSTDHLHCKSYLGKKTPLKNKDVTFNLESIWSEPTCETLLDKKLFGHTQPSSIVWLVALEVDMRKRGPLIQVFFSNVLHSCKRIEGTKIF